MDLPPNQSLALPAVDGRFASHAEIDEAIDELIKEATAEHPSVVAAKSQLDAARAKEREVRAQGWPSISLVGRDARNNQSISPAVGSQALPAYGRDTYLGIQITLPIFEGFARTYQVRQAAAQIEVQRATFDETLRKVSLDVWTSYHTLHTSIDNLDNSATLLSVAESSYDATERRYLAGVGGILELLSAQTSLAGAKRQRIIALTDWRSARLQLAGALGRLGSWNIPTGRSQ